MHSKLHVGIACGGTGGHTYPGLAVAETLKERGHRVTVWISGKDIENKTLDSWSGDVVRIHAEGFQFGISWKSLRTLYQLFLGLLSAIPILRRDRPDIILAMGSYSSFAPVAGAIVLRIPYILHEANVIPGRLVSMMTSKANAIAISFESSRYYIKHPMVVDTGMPLRIDLQRKITTPKEIENNKFCILITGGSRGAKKLNEVIPLALKKLNIQHKFKVIHLIGLNQIEPVKKIYEESEIEAEVLSYVHNIEKYYDECDLVISRSGASTCAELCAFGKPSLLIPYPYAVHDHQMLNARALEKAGAADVIAQKDLTVDWLTSYLSQVIRDPERRRKQIFSATQLAKINAADSVSILLEQVCNERG